MIACYQQKRSFRFGRKRLILTTKCRGKLSRMNKHVIVAVCTLVGTLVWPCAGWPAGDEDMRSLDELTRLNAARKALVEFGMLGTWARDCDKDASREYPRVTWSVAGIPTITGDNGEQRLASALPRQDNVSVIMSAQIVSQNKLRLVLVDKVFFATGIEHERIEVVIVRNGDNYSTWDESAEGRQVVKDGHYVIGEKSGLPAVPLEKCR